MKYRDVPVGGLMSLRGDPHVKLQDGSVIQVVFKGREQMLNDLASGNTDRYYILEDAQPKHHIPPEAEVELIVFGETR